jgi:hypothetical protein
MWCKGYFYGRASVDVWVIFSKLSEGREPQQKPFLRPAVPAGNKEEERCVYVCV